MTSKLNWIGPLKVKEYLANCINRDPSWAVGTGYWPPDSGAIYLVTTHSWRDRPTQDAGPLYVGGNTSQSGRFATRVGDLIADMHGFYTEKTGHHSGGISLWKWCEAQQHHPGELYLAWACVAPGCQCAEREIFVTFPHASEDGKIAGLLNKIVPPRCQLHSLT